MADEDFDGTTYDYKVLAVNDWDERHHQRTHRLEVELAQLGRAGWLLLLETEEHELVFARPINPPPPSSTATRLTLTIKGAHEMGTTFNVTVDDTGAVANLQFTDDHGDAEAGPSDSVTGAPIVPVVTSDNTDVTTVASAVAGDAPGSYTAALSEVAVGTANIGVAPLENSDGSPVNETAGANEGQPFALPDPVAVEVGPGPVEGLTLSVTG